VKDARLLFALLFVMAETPLFGQALGCQITTDHAGFISMPGFKPPLQVKWSINFAGTASYPIITGGKVFAIDGGSESVPSTLYALDISTGATLWSQPVPAGYGGWIGFAYDNGGLFGAPRRLRDSNRAPCLPFPPRMDTRSGAPISLANTSLPRLPPHETEWYTREAPGGGGTVYGVKEANGQGIWTAEVQNGDSSTPAVTDNGVYVPAGNTLVALQ
jgi:hypothetical protein